MIREIALKVPGDNGGTVDLQPIAGMPDSGLPTLQAVLRLGITYLFIAAVLATLFFIIWGAIQWTSSGGDAKAIDGARKKITFAVVGLIITFMSFFIINMISGFFGISLLKLNSSGAAGNGNGGTSISKTPTRIPTQDPCKKNPPVIVMDPTTWHLGAGGEAKYLAKITNKDSKECEARTFNLTLTIPPNFTGSLEKNSININPGYTNNVQVKIKSPKQNIRLGTYTGSVKLSPSGKEAQFKYEVIKTTTN